MQDYKKEEPKHLVETARNLAREGIVTEPIEYGMLHVTLGGKGLCWVSESGIGFYKEDISGNDSREVLDRVREIACDVKVLAPTAQTVDVSVELWAQEGRSFEEVAGAVRDALEDWFNGERLGRPLPRAQITSLVFGVDGVANCEILSPAADLPLDNVTLPVLGALDITRGESA